MTEMTMVERVARFLCKADGIDPDGPVCGVFVPDDPDSILPWAPYRQRARDLVAEMREPTEAMNLMGSLELFGEIGERVDGRALASDTWQAMIDEALK